MSLRPLEEITVDPTVVGRRRRNTNYMRNCSAWVLQLLNTPPIILCLKIYGWRKVAKRVTIEVCPLRNYYAPSSGNSLPTFRGNVGPNTSARNYHYSLRNNPEERSSYPSPGGSVKSQRHKVCETWKQSLIFVCKSCYNNILSVSRSLLHKKRAYVEVYFGFHGDFNRTGNGILFWKKKI